MEGEYPRYLKASDRKIRCTDAAFGLLLATNDMGVEGLLTFAAGTILELPQLGLRNRLSRSVKKAREESVLS